MNRPDCQCWQDAWRLAQRQLTSERGDLPYWEGRLSDSALATATAVAALHLADPADNAARVDRGLAWLATNRNADGGWGDSPDSPSNPSCTALVLAAQRICGRPVEQAGQAYLDSTGGLAAIPARYGADRTFSVPILTQAAIAGDVDWDDVPALPLELAALPRWTFRLGPMPVVSYALPALIAIGLVRFSKQPPRNPLIRWLRRAVTARVLTRLEAIQPTSGGFLEAAPLTSFVAMSLAAAGLSDHRVTRQAAAFLQRSQRDNGAWPIDENLSIWNTTMAVTATGEGDVGTRDWLLGAQNLTPHPYTGAAAGGWGWSHLPGSVPDTDDTAGALRALAMLPPCEASNVAAIAGVRWLLDLQNRDGGWPTFCRGWGKLEFDRSAPDLTAHATRAMAVWRNHCDASLQQNITTATTRAFSYLAATQRPDGAWLPLWFGSQATEDQANPVFGTSRVLTAYRDLGLSDSAPARSARDFLLNAANPDGGWGAARGAPSTIEETAAAVDAMADVYADTKSSTEGHTGDSPIRRGVDWLAGRIIAGGLAEPTPIGLYFARLWYHERLYPVSGACSALRRVLTAANML